MMSVLPKILWCFISPEVMYECMEGNFFFNLPYILSYFEDGTL